MLLNEVSQVFFDGMKEMYSSSCLPTCLLDEDLQIVWYNAAAKRVYPTLALPNGADCLLQPYLPQDIKNEIEERGSFAPPVTKDNLFSSIPVVITRSPKVYNPFYILHLRSWEDANTDTGTHLTGLQNSIACFESNYRTPISAIYSAVSLLRNQLNRQHLNNIPVDEYVNLIGENSTKLLRSTQMFTDFTRLSNGLYRDTSVRVDLYAHLESILEEISLILGETEIEFSYSLSDILNKSIFVVIAKEPLQYILGQLVSNACRFTRPGNLIQISVTSTEEKVSIIVTDRGIGISPAIAHRVFEPFFSYSPRGDAFAGNGLGLSIAQQCAAYLQGELTFTSSEGKGTSFRLTLPIVDDRSMAAEAHTYTDDLELSTEIRVLLADAIPCKQL